MTLPEANPNRHSVKIFLSFFVMLTLCLSMTYYWINNRLDLEKLKMEEIVNTKIHATEITLSELLYKTQTLSALVVQSDGSVTNFERTAAIITKDKPIRNVLLAPGGIVKYVYPLKTNEKVLGFDMFSQNAGNAEALEARESGKLVLGGPFTLTQGGEALVGRLPVYVGKSFWGLCSVTLNYPDALAGANLEELQLENLAYEIYRISPDTGKRQIIAHSKYEYDKDAPYVEKKMVIHNAEWFFRLSPVRPWYAYFDSWLLIICSIIISIMTAFLTKYILHLSWLKERLEEQSLTDALTGVFNRRGLIKTTKELFTASKPNFLLSFVDFDKFKNINDAYGHQTGDTMLIRFAELITDNMGPNSIVARIGGDEFLLIQYGGTTAKERDEFWRTIRAQCKGAVNTKFDEKIDIEFSLGFSACPQDGTELSPLIGVADRNMYKNKRQNRK